MYGGIAHLLKPCQIETLHRKGSISGVPIASNSGVLVQSRPLFAGVQCISLGCTMPRSRRRPRRNNKAWGVFGGSVGWRLCPNPRQPKSEAHRIRTLIGGPQHGVFALPPDTCRQTRPCSVPTPTTTTTHPCRSTAIDNVAFHRA